MIGTLRSVVLDTRDVAGLSAFYVTLAGWSQQYGDDEWVTLRTPDGWRIGIQAAPDHVPPQWPQPDQPQQAHLDLRVPDLEAATARATGLGARLLARHETWHTLADPAGHPFDVCLQADAPATDAPATDESAASPAGAPATVVAGVMLDCPDAAALSAFYAQLLGKPVTFQADGMAMIGADGDQPVMFQQVAAYVAPAWPDPSRPQQVHLDVTVQDIDAAERAALAIGATRLPGQGDNWRVYADPAGKPFCLVW